MDEARNYYEDYGRQEGFWIRTRSSSKTRLGSNEVTSRKFVCAHQGKYVTMNKSCDIEEEKNNKETSEFDDTRRSGRNCSTIKCGCEASMRIVHDKWSNKWRVSIFKDTHNHKIVSPAKRIKMKSNKHMPGAAKSLTEAFHRENLQVGKVCSILGGAHIGFDSRDCYDHLRNVRHRQLDGGDAQSVLTYFREEQVENPRSYHMIESTR
ncbi:hypothetical protein Q3G72_008203 [Acer saccharum]|nr:hypothetical protein Q3G72_008203 [Acer saccharum]